jgi:hypothetical protein
MISVTKDNTVFALRRSPRLMSIVAKPLALPMHTLQESYVLLSGGKTLNPKEEDIVLRNMKNHMYDDVNNVYEITKVFEIFNDNIKVLKKLNKPYDSSKPLSNEPFKFDILLRELFHVSEFLIKKMKTDKAENIVPFTGMSSVYIDKLKLISVMNLTRDLFYKRRHIHFDA